jgi:cobalt-zinc-cadmium efflux system protein
VGGAAGGRGGSLALLAARLAARPLSPCHSYGMGRAELLAALVNALAMLAVVFGIGMEAWSRFQSPRPIAGALVMDRVEAGMPLEAAVAAVAAWRRQQVAAEVPRAGAMPM